MKFLRLTPLALIAGLFACAGGSSSPRPLITSFAASPLNIGRGGSSTLTWAVSGATQLSLSPDFGALAGTSVTVNPLQTTTYTLTATGAGGSTTAQVTVNVSDAPQPIIDAFTASPDNLPRGKSSTLSWSATGADSYSITPGVGAVSGTSVSVAPSDTTTYTLTARGAGGTSTAQLTITVRAAVMHLEYTDPSATADGVRLVKSAASTDTRIVLDALVGTHAVSAYGVAINLPFDVTRAALSSDQPFMPNLAALDPGSAPTTAAIAVPVAGPLQNALVLGLARKKTYSTDGDVALAAGTRLFSLAFDLKAGAGEGVVFDGVSPGNKFDAALIKADGTRAVDRGGFSIGQLIATY